MGVDQQPRRRIIDAALRLTARNGYDSVQVRTLSELAGVSSRTIYEQFPSLDSVIIVAVSEEYEKQVQRLLESEEAAAKSDAPASALPAHISAAKPAIN